MVRQPKRPSCNHPRQKNQGDISDSGDPAADFESSRAFKEDVDECDSLHGLKNEGNQGALHEMMGDGWGEKRAYKDEIFDQDDVFDSQTDGCVCLDETQNNSCFHRHFGHVLTNEEIDMLTKEKLKFKWEMLVKVMNMAKLVGTGQNLSTELNGNPFCAINHKLHDHWKNVYGSFSFSDLCSSKRRLFFSLCNTYRDIMHCDKRPFYLGGKEDDSSIMDAYIMHALNHIHRIREHVLKNDAKLKKDESHKMEEIHRGGTYLDQGFTRPKVMLLLPLASIAFQVVNRLVQLSPLAHKGNVAYMDRFSDEFGMRDLRGDENNTDGSVESQKRAKPADFQNLFGGNNNDHFMFGIKFTKYLYNLNIQPIC